MLPDFLNKEKIGRCPQKGSDLMQIHLCEYSIVFVVEIVSHSDPLCLLVLVLYFPSMSKFLVSATASD